MSSRAAGATGYATGHQSPLADVVAAGYATGYQSPLADVVAAGSPAGTGSSTNWLAWRVNSSW